MFRTLILLSLTGSNFKSSPNSNLEPDKSKTSAPISENTGGKQTCLNSKTQNLNTNTCTA